VAYSCQKGTITDITKGVISINPKDKGGDAIIRHFCPKHTGGTANEGYFNNKSTTSK